MKSIKSLSALLLCVLFLSGSCSNDDSEPDLNNCNVEAFEAYARVVELATEYGENATTSNCNALKQAAQNAKNVLLRCNLWGDDEEIEDIINLDCS